MQISSIRPVPQRLLLNIVKKQLINCHFLSMTGNWDTNLNRGIFKKIGFDGVYDSGGL